MKNAVKEYFGQLSGNLKIDKLKTDLQAVAKDIKNVQKSVVPEAEKTFKQAELKYNQIVKKIAVAQKQLKNDFKKARARLNKSVDEVEDLLGSYKDMVVKQKIDLKKTFVKKAKPAAKKVARVRVKAKGKVASKTAAATKAKTTGLKAKGPAFKAKATKASAKEAGKPVTPKSLMKKQETVKPEAKKPVVATVVPVPTLPV